MSNIYNTGLQTTDSKLYILDLDTQESMEIQFVPDNLSIDRKIRLNAVNIIARNLPKYQYSGGQTELDFRLDFYADEENRVSVIQRCKWLEGFTVNDKGRSPQKKLALIFGSMFRDDIWIMGEFKYKLENFDKQFGMYPKQAYVDIKLHLTTASNTSFTETRGIYQRGQDDGRNPINLGTARGSDDNGALKNFEQSDNPNTFDQILQRAISRLGYTRYKY